MAGLASFFGFGKKNKVNQTQAFRELPTAESSPMWGSLSELARKRINNEGTGFGDDFTSLANPGIAQIDANFKNRTLPTLSSEASKRGLARSSIVQDQIGQSDLQRSRDISSMVANFEMLNRQQKKTDQQSGINLGSQLQSDYLNSGANASNAFNATERGNTERTAGVAATNNANSLARQNQTLQALGSLISPSLDAAFTPKQTQAPISSSNQFFGGSSGVQTQLLGSLDPSHLDAMSIEELLKLFGG